MADDDDSYRSLGQTVSDTQRQVQKGKDDRKSGGGWRAGAKAAGSSLSSSGQDMMDRAASDRITPVSFKKGGRVKARKSRVKPRK
jgi:hypothetical protein